MKSWRQVVLLVVLSGIPACKGGGDKNPDDDTHGQGLCVDTCPISCDVDRDCDTAKGDLCCDYGGGAKACVAAKACPRFCTMDNMCNTASGEACLRTALGSSAMRCVEPKHALKLCSSDQVCKQGEKCCTIYKEAVCLPIDR